MKGLCKYANVLGKPGEGAHKHVAGIAVFDLVGTILIAFLVARLFRWKFWLVLTVLLVLGVILHRLFCVNTTINKLIFGTVGQ